MALRRRLFAASQVIILVAACVGAVASSSADQWVPVELVLLLAVLAVASDFIEVPTRSIHISGVHVVFVLAMALLGPAPTAAIAVMSILVAGFRSRPKPLLLLNNLATYATFPLLGGLAIQGVRETAGLSTSDSSFLLLVFAVFLLSNLLNFVLSIIPVWLLERRSIAGLFRTIFFPLLPSELVTGLLAVGMTWFYGRVGLAALALLTGVLFTFQYLLRELLQSQHRAEALDARTRELASLQIGVVGALVHTLDLRDRMTARHSAAVARYAREIARELGLDEREQELVHTAGLLHDIGKFAFPDHILKAATKLSEADWQIIRTHPYEGARIASQIQGYGPVSEIIMAHHERIDGRGYPRRLPGDEIPLLSRVVSVADTYDVMTARDSYRTPVSSMEAIQELRRVAGTQLDSKVVEAFITILAGRDLRFRHGEDADFDAELALEARVRELASAQPTPN
jgi:putative nucleotidyltransferase with HDIG domain